MARPENVSKKPIIRKKVPLKTVVMVHLGEDYTDGTILLRMLGFPF